MFYALGEAQLRVDMTWEMSDTYAIARSVQELSYLRDVNSCFLQSAAVYKPALSCAPTAWELQEASTGVERRRSQRSA